MTEVEEGFVHHFDLPNSVSGGSLLRNVRLTRQFQRTRRAIRTELSTKKTKFENRPDFDDFTDILYKDEVNRELLAKAFENWKSVLSYRDSQVQKASIFYRFETLSLFLKKWKAWAKVQQQIRIAKQLKEEKERQKLNGVTAKWFYECKISRQYFDSWRGFSKLMHQKRHLRLGEKDRAATREKINIFLKNLHQVVQETKLTSEDSKPPMKAVRKKPGIKTPKLPDNPVSVVSEKMKKKIIKFEDQKGLVLPSNEKTKLPRKGDRKAGNDENKIGKVMSRILPSGTPSLKTRNIEIVPSTEATKTSKPQKDDFELEDVNHEFKDLSKKVEVLAQTNSRKSKEEKELRALEKLKQEIESGRAVTNLKLYRSVFKTDDNFSEGEDYYSSEPQYLEHEIRAGDVLQMRIQATVCDNEFMSKPKDKKPEPVASIKSKIRNIEVKQFGPKSNNESPIFENEDYRAARLSIESDNKNGFLMRMKMRQQERERKRNEIRRYHQIRAEESRLQRAEEAALKVRLEQEEKEQKREELKMLRKKIKEREKLKEEEKERQQLLNQIAKNWQTTSSMKKCFNLWNRLISNRRLKEFVAEKLHEKILMRTFINNWHVYQQSEELRTMSEAESYFERRTISRHFYRWMEQTLKSVKKNQASSDFRDFKLTLNSFERWRKLAHQSLQREWKLARNADKFFEQLLMKKAWAFWRKAVCEKDTLLELEILRKRLHEKVTLEVSDYIPDQMREV